jgi:hypothetical protein
MTLLPQKSLKKKNWVFIIYAFGVTIISLVYQCICCYYLTDRLTKFDWKLVYCWLIKQIIMYYQNDWKAQLTDQI